LQYLKHLQCKITAVCSTKHIETVKNLGADIIFDYTTKKDYKHEIRPKSIDTILDVAGIPNEEEMFSLLKPGGTFVTVRGHLIQSVDRYSSPLLGLGNHIFCLPSSII
jgi:NADPH:quinone reductase-like Zn-dependent oxidoreductase